MISVLGIDPSLTSLGYAYSSDDKSIVGTVRPKRLQGAARLKYILEEVREVVSASEPALIAYEGYAMGRFAGGGRLADLGELGGVLKLLAYESNIPLLIVPPSCLKLFATGKGNADKDAVMVAMAKHRGRLFSSNDEADAYALYLMGLAYSDRRQRPRDPRHYKHAALRSCKFIGVCGD